MSDSSTEVAAPPTETIEADKRGDAGAIGNVVAVKDGKAIVEKEQEAPPDPVAQINELIAKAGLKVKANGKEYDVKDIGWLMRQANRGIPIEHSLAELQEQRAQLEPAARMMQALQSDDDDVREAALAKLLGPEKFLSVAEKALRRQFEQERELEGLSPREKEMARKLREQEATLTDLQKRQLAARQQQEQAVYQQQVESYRQHIADNVGEALTQLDLPKEMNSIAVDFMKPIVRQMLNAGMPLDPAVLAEKVAPVFDSLLQYKAKALEGEKLLKFFGDDVGKKYRAALLGQLKEKQQVKQIDPNVVVTQGAPGAHRNTKTSTKKWSWPKGA